MTTPTAGYATLVAEAESAVAPVKDPELRRVAFEKILTTLLEQKLPGRGSIRRASPTEGRDDRPKNADGRATSKSPGGPKACIEELIRDDFFKDQRRIADVKVELGTRGRHIALTSLSGPLQKLTQERRLRRQKIIANGKGAKTTYAYSNW